MFTFFFFSKFNNGFVRILSTVEWFQWAYAKETPKISNSLSDVAVLRVFSRFFLEICYSRSPDDKWYNCFLAKWLCNNHSTGNLHLIDFCYWDTSRLICKQLSARGHQCIVNNWCLLRLWRWLNTMSFIKRFSLEPHFKIYSHA